MWLVERDRELSVAQGLVEVTRAGTGGLLVIEGPSGIGKSALLGELAGRAAAGALAVRSVRATPLGAEVPFALARWLLEPAVHAVPSALEAGWARHARSLFDGEVGGPGDQRLLVEGLVALVAELRRAGGPLALIVDDVQWSDPASLEFLGELAVRCEDLGVAVAVAIGTGQGQVDGRSLHRLASAAGPRLLQPAPLSADAVRALV
ncbi:MAG: ATP-binding protein, partial [Solirubrobacteraceae bacterium]